MTSLLSCVGKSGNHRARISEREKGEKRLRANLQQLLISLSDINYEKQNWKKSKVLFKITH